MELITKANNKKSNRILSIYTNINEDFQSYINTKSNYKIVLIEKGNGILKINGKLYSFFISTLIILNENDVVVLEQANNLKAYTIYFHPSTVNSKLNFCNIRNKANDLTQTEIQDIVLLNKFITKDFITELGPGSCQHIKQIILDLHYQLKLQPDGYWPCRSRSYLIELIILIERLFSKKTIINNSLTSLQSETANEILLYIHNNISNKITIAKISKVLGINKNLIQKHIANATGLSLMAYVTNLRIQMACFLLKDTAIPIKEIASRCGYNDITNFGKQFKKITGLAPSIYKSTINTDIKNLQDYSII